VLVEVVAASTLSKASFFKAVQMTSLLRNQILRTIRFGCWSTCPTSLCSISGALNQLERLCHVTVLFDFGFQFVGVRVDRSVVMYHFQVRQAKPREREYKLADYASLYLLIRPNGSKLWRLDYRFGGKQKTLALDAYPIVTLADARERKLEKIAAAAGGNTFREVAEELLAKQAREGRAAMTTK
jgi:hypothetical protein